MGMYIVFIFCILEVIVCVLRIILTPHTPAPPFAYPRVVVPAKIGPVSHKEHYVNFI